MPTRNISPSACSFFATLLLAFAALAAQPARDADAPRASSAPSGHPALASSERAESLREQSSVSGGTGLLHLQDPLAGAAGTFRISLLFDSYKGSGFLCNAATPCPGVQEDVASHFGTTFGLSVTPLSYLEAYASLSSFANSNNARTPSLISAVGNTTFALKLFTPEPLANMLRFGGAIEAGFLGSSGVVGVAGGGTSFRFLGLAQADFRGADRRGPPLRARFNVGYFWDNSGSLVKDVERDRHEPVTRIERFGLDVNRVDQLQLGLGLDAPLGVVRPFAEWNVGVPVNRQGYTCYPTLSFSGDGCLATDAALSAFPSKLTLGARLFPWLTGISATAALDVGTSGTSRFIEELAPTLPWGVWLGIGYGIDAIPPPPVIIHEKPVESPPVARRAPVVRLHGLVHDASKDEGIAKAIVTFQGRDLTGMVTGSDGRFTSADLEPGTFTLAVEAPGFESGECTATIAADTVPPKAETQASGAPRPSLPRDAQGPPLDSPRYVEVDCPLKPVPPFGRLSGSVHDSSGAMPLGGVTATLRDNLGRELTVTTDPSGSFNFESIPPGSVTFLLQLEGYLFHGETVEIPTRSQVRREVSLRRRPTTPRVTKRARELVLTQPIRTDEATGEPTTESIPLLEEVADLMARTPEIRRVEVQAHSDASGEPSQDEAVTQRRATAVRDWLVAHGVDPSRLSARGLGSTQPLSPNVTPAGRARNRRVKLVISD